MNTIEDLEKMFPTEESARKYLVNLRWGQWAQCPYCGNKKAYIIEKGERFKCANKECYKKFSVTVKTVFEASNLKIAAILKISFLYIKSRGRISPFELTEAAEITPKTEFLIREKLDFIWKFIVRDGKTNHQILDDFLKTSFDCYDKFKKVKEMPYYNNPFHLTDINDISDTKQYNQLMRYTKYFINVYANWMFMDFASPTDILSETFLWMRDNGIKEYDTDSLLRYIRNTASKMWVCFLNNHPKFNEYIRINRKKYKREKRINLSESYIVDVIQGRKNNKLTRREIKSNQQLVKETKEKIIGMRKTKNVLYDFNSHFD